MPRFALEFETHINDGDTAAEGEDITRVIVAEDEKMAMQIGQAMIGEEIFPWQWLNALKSAKPTDVSAQFPASDDSKSWQRTLDKLNLKNNEVRLIKRGRIIVGVVQKE